MVICRPRLVTLALFWLVAFLVSLSIYVASLFAYVCTTCTIQGVGEVERCEDNNEQCRYSVDVTLKLQMADDKFQHTARTPCERCPNNAQESFEEEFGKNDNVKCWYRKRDRNNVQLAGSSGENTSRQSEVLAGKSPVLLAVTVIFAVFFVVVMIRIFETELIRICPRCILTAWMNLPSIRRRRRSSSSASVPHGQMAEDFVSPPSAITSRRRISKLIEASQLSASEAKALREDGWSCCICLEEKNDDEQLRPVARLKCNHATHSECLRLWLETGRAACCLCNADVFSDGTKEPSLSSRASSTSVGDAGLIGSLVVERTDHTPSSPGTSVFIDASQPYSDTTPSNDERDGDIESGV